MTIIYSIIDYMKSFNNISKNIIKITLIIVFFIYVASMYFALAAGRTMDYYAANEIFMILTENAKAILACGILPALLFEPIYKSYTDSA